MNFYKIVRIILSKDWYANKWRKDRFAIKKFIIKFRHENMYCKITKHNANKNPQPTKTPLGSEFLLRVLSSFMFFFLCIKIILLFNDIEQDFHSTYFYWIFNIKQKPYHQHRIFIKKFLFLTHRDEGKRVRRKCWRMIGNRFFDWEIQSRSYLMSCKMLSSDLKQSYDDIPLPGSLFAAFNNDIDNTRSQPKLE